MSAIYQETDVRFENGENSWKRRIRWWNDLECLQQYLANEKKRKEIACFFLLSNESLSDKNDDDGDIMATKALLAAPPWQSRTQSRSRVSSRGVFPRH